MTIQQNSHLIILGETLKKILFQEQDIQPQMKLLEEVLNAFELFLRGAGFHFDGHLEFVDENNNPTNTSYADVNQPEFQNQQLEFDFVKELFTDLGNFDKDTDLDLDDKKAVNLSFYSNLETTTNTTQVVHCKKSEYDVYIGKLFCGVIHILQKRTLAKYFVGSKSEAIQSYEEYLESSPKLLEALKDLKGKRCRMLV